MACQTRISGGLPPKWWRGGVPMPTCLIEPEAPRRAERLRGVSTACRICESLQTWQEPSERSWGSVALSLHR